MSARESGRGPCRSSLYPMTAEQPRAGVKRWELGEVGEGEESGVGRRVVGGGAGVRFCSRSGARYTSCVVVAQERPEVSRSPEGEDQPEERVSLPACLEENFSWTAELLVCNRKLFWSSRRRQSSVVAVARLGCCTPGSGSASGLARAASALAAMSLATDAAGRRRRGVGGDWPLAEGWLLLLALLVLPGTPGTRAFVCLPCDESRCEEPKNCPGGVVLDICGCCFICARQRNESCGGFFGLHGACDRGLRCVIRPPLNGDSLTEYEAGVCEEEKPDCSKARCEVQFSPRCPEDSILIEGYAPPGECCPLPSRCVCNPAGCLRKVCQPGYLNILVSKASGKPGECCDFYECKPVFSVDCSTVECPPVQQVACPLDSYETQVRLTADGCCTLPTRCECLSGLCGVPKCEPGFIPQIVSRGDGTPGKCCDVFECVNEVKPACIFNSVEYNDGDMFRMDTCRFCQCQGGVSICFSAQCGELHCDRYYVPEGECCPVCEDSISPISNPAGCYANSQIQAHGDRWREDDCTFCQCINGESHCVATACGQSCLNPVKVPGECCPMCEEPTYITIGPPTCPPLVNCTLKETDCIYDFKVDQNGCRICQCKTREERCTDLMSDCSLDCDFGFQTDVHNCKICQCHPRPKKCKAIVCDKYCPFGYFKNKHGCEICRCKKCPELSCGKICPMGFQKNNQGCNICKCAEIPASIIPPAKVGTCLSVDGHRHENEESWHDGCRDCYCHNGREMCALITCSVPNCGNPTIHPGQCCPSCPDESIAQKPEISGPTICYVPGGEYFMEGDTWNIDSCTQCTCHNARVLCETEVCPPLLCRNPTRTQDSCCPQCPDEPVQPSLSTNKSMPSYCKNDDGDIFLTAESWKPNVCTSCICLDGGISCYSESCPPVSCEKPVLRKGQCCPYCIEDTAAKKAVCHFNGKTYADEERWDIDSCTHCYCLQGQTLCSTVSCPSLPCVEPINVEGSCCPMCPEMYVPEPTNIPIEKTNHRGDKELEAPVWPTFSENDVVHIHKDMGHLQGEYRETRGSQPTAEASLDSLAWVTVPLLTALVLIIALLFINQKKQWIPVSCYRTPAKPSCLNNQLVYVDCKKGTMVQVDSSQRMLRIADPDSRYSGFYSMQKQSNLQADNFYQTV
ncbi:cysteine-rich motor neuron 1 protein isoform X2 [Pantherophis guttatus]|uniref:Cysteine-rich motor neuron 1 protein isoform X2 n=1 Tax=Pantherophis guttatus TaxID=94885 RepID=A0A6P9CXA5_PANGU|nr:cysteine-rich motor neuron 1 protein isoform X2 [Pantherophis guttatus]